MVPQPPGTTVIKSQGCCYEVEIKDWRPEKRDLRLEIEDRRLLLSILEFIFQGELHSLARFYFILAGGV